MNTVSGDLDTLQTRLQNLETENATLREQLKHAERNLERFVPFATPEQEAAMELSMKEAIPFEIEEFLQELEREVHANG